MRFVFAMTLLVGVAASGWRKVTPPMKRPSEQK